MLNKCFISGFLREVPKSTSEKILPKELQKKIILFEIDAHDVLKSWKGSRKYQRIKCIAHSNIMKQVKELIEKKHKGVIIIEGHLGRPNEENDDVYLIVDKLVLTTIL